MSTRKDPHGHAEALAATRRCADLSDLSATSLQTLAEAAARHDLAPGSQLTHDEDASHGLFVVAGGICEVLRRDRSHRAPLRAVAHAGTLLGVDALVGTPSEQVTAISRATVYELPLDVLDRLATSDEAVSPTLSRLVTLFEEAAWLCARLRDSALLRRASPDDLLTLVGTARLVDAPPLTLIAPSGVDPGGVTVVLEGELFLRGSGGTMRLVQRGQVTGDLELMACRPAAYSVVTGVTGCRFARIDTAAIDELFVRNAAFRRAVLSSEYGSAEQRGRLVARATATRPSPLAILHLTGEASPKALQTAAGWLAELNGRAFRDRTALVHLDPSAPLEPIIERPPRDERGVPLRVRTRPDVFPEEGSSLLRALRAADTVYVASRHGSLDPEGPWLRGAETTAWLATTPWKPAPREVLGRLRDPLVYATVVPSGRGRPTELPRGAVRISEKIPALAEQGTPLAALSEGHREQVARWARAVTCRRVGLALSGGGGLGYAHVALIRAIRAAGLPVDLVTGTSAGAVMGAFYAAQGLAGLDRAVALGPELHAICRRAPLSSRVLGSAVDRWLDHVQLEDLVVPLYATAIDVESSLQVTLRTGPIGTAVRAASSFPPAFGPTVAYEGGRRRRLVDGAVINNIPDDQAYLEGARVVVACNAIPAPRRERTPGIPEGSRRARLLARLPAGLASALEESLPLPRFHDLLRATQFTLFQPDDWEARRAEVRHRPRDAGYSPLDFARSEEMMRAFESPPHSEDLARTVERLQRELAALRWRRVRSASVTPAIPRSTPAVGAPVPAAAGPMLLDEVAPALSVAAPALSSRMSIQLPARPPRDEP